MKRTLLSLDLNCKALLLDVRILAPAKEFLRPIHDLIRINW